MATRREIRETFYDELDTATTVATITQQSPNSVEELPAITHTHQTREDVMNRGTAPTSVTTDEEGDQTYTYSELLETQFTVTMLSDDVQEQEDVYEDVHSHFKRYDNQLKSPSSLHEDVYRVNVADVQPNDMVERQPRVRGDALTVSVFYQQFYEQDVNPTTGVALNVDADNDGVADETYTTT